MSGPVHHPQSELEQAREAVVEAARALLAARIPNTSTFPHPPVRHLAGTLEVLRKLRVDNDEAEAALRRALRLSGDRTVELHLVEQKDHRYTMCDRDVGAVPYGLARPDFVDEWIAAGQTMCPECMSAYRGGS